MNHYKFIPFEFPQTKDGAYFYALDDAGILRSRRTQLGLTMQQVADMAGIKLSQYQRLESGERHLSGCSMRIGLAICAVLLLDPYAMVGVDVQQKEDMKPQEIIADDNDNINILHKIDEPKKAGRKQIRHDIWTGYLNYGEYSVLVTYDALAKIGSPKFIQLRYEPNKHILAIFPAKKTDDEIWEVREQHYEYMGVPMLGLPNCIGGSPDNNPMATMNWGKVAQKVRVIPVKNNDGTSVLLFDMTTAQPIEKIDDMAIIIGAK